MIRPVSNSGSFRALFQLEKSQRGLDRTMDRLSSGKKVNSGRDNPAALISSEQLAAEIAALEAQSKSYARASSQVSITDGHAAQVSSMLSEMNALVVASANDAGLSDDERAAYQMQIDSLATSIQRFAGDAVGSMDGFNMEGGGNAELEAMMNRVTAAVQSIRSGGANDLSSGNLDSAQKEIGQAITDAASFRGTLGAYQKDTLEPSIRANQVAVENLMDAKSRLLDADFGEETANLARYEVLTKAGMKVLGIINEQAKSVLDLFA
jgi:flagellin